MKGSVKQSMKTEPKKNQLIGTLKIADIDTRVFDTPYKKIIT